MSPSLSPSSYPIILSVWFLALSHLSLSIFSLFLPFLPLSCYLLFLLIFLLRSPTQQRLEGLTVEFRSRKFLSLSREKSGLVWFGLVCFWWMSRLNENFEPKWWKPQSGKPPEICFFWAKSSYYKNIFSWPLSVLWKGVELLYFVRKNWVFFANFLNKIRSKFLWAI